MQISGKGAVVGAIVGFLARGAVVLLNVPPDTRALAFMALPSAVIGALVGAMAGASGRPVRGAILGAILSGVVFEAFMLSCASVIGTFSQPAGPEFLMSTFGYALQMAVAGALAGLAGGAADASTRTTEVSKSSNPPAGETSP
jgi:hypothetical protein